jgi:putative membrane protein
MEKEQIMEKEIDIDRQKLIHYYMWSGALTCLVLLPVFGIGLILAIILVVDFLTLCPRRVDAMRYFFDKRALRVEKGVLFKSRKTIPLDKITDLELVQGPLLRVLNMWNIKVQTASTAQQLPEATLYGVVNPEQVRDEILAAKDEYIKSR